MLRRVREPCRRSTRLNAVPSSVAHGSPEPVRGHPRVPRGHPEGRPSRRRRRGGDRAHAGSEGAPRWTTSPSASAPRSTQHLASVFVGMKARRPRDHRGRRGRARRWGRGVVVGIVLAPHCSVLSIAGYRERLERGLRARRGALVESWHTTSPSSPCSPTSGAART